MIEAAYTEAEAGGLAVWCQDEAGPYQAIPQPGATWHPAGHPACQPHEYVRGGTAQLLTLFRPATGEVRAQGVRSAPNAVLHPWLKDHLLSVLAELAVHPLPVHVPLPAGAHLGALVVVLRTPHTRSAPPAPADRGQSAGTPEL